MMTQQRAAMASAPASGQKGREYTAGARQAAANAALCAMASWRDRARPPVVRH